MQIISGPALLLTAGLCLSLFFAAGKAEAQEFPTKLLRLVVPYPAGGGADAIARLLADRLSKDWGQSVIVETRSGAGGTTGADFVAKSPPDGYVVLFSPSPVYSTAKALYPNLPFDPETDLKPVTLVSVSPNVLMVPTILPISDLKGLIDYAKAHPNSVTYASQGVGTTGHLTGAYLAQVANIPIRHVPYRGAAPALTDLAAGHVTMAWDGLSSALGLISGGKVRPIAIAAPKRSPVLPDVPTVIEAGFPGFESASWYGVTVPKGTPDAVVRKLSESFARALRQPDVYKHLTQIGAEVIASSPDELAAYMKIDAARWKRVIDAAKIQLDAR